MGPVLSFRSVDSACSNVHFCETVADRRHVPIETSPNPIRDITCSQVHGFTLSLHTSRLARLSIVHHTWIRACILSDVNALGDVWRDIRAEYQRTKSIETTSRISSLNFISNLRVLKAIPTRILAAFNKFTRSLAAYGILSSK